MIKQRNERLQNLFKSGMTVSEIVKQTGWSRETVRKAVKDLPEYQSQVASKSNKSSVVQSTQPSQKDLTTQDALNLLHKIVGSKQQAGSEEQDELLEATQKLDVKWVANSSMVNVVINGKVYAADSSHPNFKAIIDACLGEQFLEVPSLIETGKTIEQFSEGLFKYQDGTLTYAGEELHGVLVQKIIDSLRSGNKDVIKFVRFIEHALNNQQNSIDEMWNFIKHNDIEINENGFIVGYKKVTSDKEKGLVDSHTGTVVNIPGTIVTMPRQFVNDNKNETCSYGLHVGSIDYVREFSGDTIIKVLVNPSEVVSVPTDYNGQKMRCAEYFVQEVLDDDLNPVETATHITGFSLVNRTGLVEYTENTENN